MGATIQEIVAVVLIGTYIHRVHVIDAYLYSLLYGISTCDNIAGTLRHRCEVVFELYTQYT